MRAIDLDTLQKLVGRWQRGSFLFKKSKLLIFIRMSRNPLLGAFPSPPPRTTLESTTAATPTPLQFPPRPSTSCSRRQTISAAWYIFKKVNEKKCNCLISSIQESSCVAKLRLEWLRDESSVLNVAITELDGNPGGDYGITMAKEEAEAEEQDLLHDGFVYSTDLRAKDIVELQLWFAKGSHLRVKGFLWTGDFEGKRLQVAEDHDSLVTSLVSAIISNIIMIRIRILSLFS